MEAATGLGALGFWFFIASVVVGSMWFDARKRESEQETLRRILESDSKIDPEAIEKLLSVSQSDERTDRSLKISGLITLFVAPGLLILGWFMSALADEMWSLMLGVAGLVAFVGVGLLVASKIAEGWYKEP